MKTLTLYLLCLAVACSRGNPLIGSRFPIGNDEDRGSECNQDCSSASKRQVCGTDGRTYDSRCHITVANCRGSHVQVEHRGKCKESSRCKAERRYAQAQLSNDSTVGLFIPECNDDGSFQQVQCHTGTGYCWCVTDLGKPIPGSSVRYKQPKCNSDGGKPSRPGGFSRPRKGCSQSQRQEFNTNLIDIFKNEYARLPTKPPTNRQDYMVDMNLQALAEGFMNSEEKEVIDWKFSELDQNGNGELKKKELKSITKLIKKHVEPRVCARNFAKYCDPDQNQAITNSEWASCLGVDNNDDPIKRMELPKPTLARAGPTTVDVQDPNDQPEILTPENRGNPARPSKKVEHSCTSDRQKAREEATASPEESIFIPVCREDGTFRPAQCHDAMQYCWCVYTDSGRPISGTATQNEMPKCDEEARSAKPVVVLDREMKGCPSDKKESFLTDLLDKLTTEMVENSEDGLDTEPDPEDSLEESTVKWKFRKLDGNNNDMIDKKEATKFRKEIKNLKPKKCTRNFIRYCDADSDRKISLPEWVECFGLAREEKISEPTRGTNPFIFWLKSVDKLQ
ncbi:SPARC-related modular calcium-binding protein 1-like isoform X4 [Ptychodera flava]|uniref:SPARC-related modular calcium-binding protein 1-like isoform X4 n=1 Tax=Ptychodera flava TaxID=63121 RepID=UPI00396A88B1